MNLIPKNHLTPLPENVVLSSGGWFKQSDHEYLERHPPPQWQVILWWISANFLFFLRIENPWERALRLRDTSSVDAFNAELDAALNYDPLADKKSKSQTQPNTL